MTAVPPGPPSPPGSPVDIVVVGGATRDLAPDDPRGWRLGGGATFAALVVAKLGLRTTALIGLDDEAATAAELALLRDAGVDLVVVPLVRGPVFENVETPKGRVQRLVQASDPMPVSLPPRVIGPRVPRGWILAPVADELPEAWADAPAPDVPVALGWQGLLRTLRPGEPVERRAPRPSRLVARADLVSLSRNDVGPDETIDSLIGLLHPGATMVITHGRRGGLVVRPPRDGRRSMERYPPISSTAVLDPTGAGDSFLSALFATHVEPRLIGNRVDSGLDLLVAAAVASLVTEGPGLLGVPTWSAVRDRVRAGRGARRQV